MNRSTQHIFGAGVVFLVGLWITWVSYTQQPAEAFLFPRLISSVFVVLAAWTFAKALMGRSKVGDGLNRHQIIGLVPGVLVMAIYVFWAAKTFGFYTATTVTVFILISLYDPAPHTNPRVWAKRALITACFMAVMYGLFALLLKVYTPREILF